MQCVSEAGEHTDLLRDFVGTEEECTAKCTELGCEVFIREGLGVSGQVTSKEMVEEFLKCKRISARHKVHLSNCQRALRAEVNCFLKFYLHSNLFLQRSLLKACMTPRTFSTKMFGALREEQTKKVFEVTF